MTQYHFTVVLEPDHEEPDRYNVHVPALSGCLTYGESIEDALKNAREAITGYVECLLADGESVPAEMNPTIATSIVVTAPRLPQPKRDNGLTARKSV
jgi:predicted RNase H-like HicB family nuclease